MTLNFKTQHALDDRLVRLLKTLRSGPSFSRLETEAREIVDLYTMNEDARDPSDQGETRLLYHGWQNHWRSENNIAYAMFGNIEKDKHANALHEVFTNLVHVGHNSDSMISFPRAVSQLEAALHNYLSIRDPDFRVELLPEAESSCVKLFGISKKPLVDGKEKEPLNETRYNIVTALIEAGDDGLSKDALVKKSGHSDAVDTLKRLAKKDADWAAVLPLPGTAGKRYRIK